MASYKKAIAWIALNDDVTDVRAGVLTSLTPSAAMAADLFGKSDEKVLADLVKEINKGATNGPN